MEDLENARFLASLVALHGIISSPIPGPHKIPENASHEAVAYADAMIKALDKKA